MKTDELRALIVAEASAAETLRADPYSQPAWRRLDDAIRATQMAAYRELPSLLDALEAAQANDRRYRFLRGSGSALYVVTGPGWRDYEGATLDAAIDHATASERGGCDG